MAAKNKNSAVTVPTNKEVADFIAAVEPASKREDAKVLDALFRKVTGEEPKMWGPTIIGYGSYDYTYDSGHSGTSSRSGFSPRKAKHSIYLMGCYCDEETEKRTARQLTRLGKHSRGKSCLYINKLVDVDLEVLEEMIADNWATMNRVYPG